MPIDKSIRTGFTGKMPTPGPFLAQVVNNKDPTFMGKLEVALMRGFPDNPNLSSTVITVKYLNPFYGVTNVAYEGGNPQEFEDVQKSYGMWFVPPDIGATVMVLFIDGNTNNGFWFGCVQDEYQNHMIPGIAASDKVAWKPGQQEAYGKVKKVPVAEFLKRSAKDNISNQSGSINPSSQLRPVHPFADRLKEQGLLTDDIRGITSSSARREIPSQVFGISTPGKLKKNGRTVRVGPKDKQQSPTPITRLGGHTFVMDDGDVDEQSQLVRIRTSAGHQILLHDSSDLIYIANSKGTAWIELTSQGKIDVYAKDSVSIRTEEDFNFRADRDINIEAQRNINIKAWGNLETNVDGYSNLIVNQDYSIFVGGNQEETIWGNAYLTYDKNLNIKTNLGNVNITSTENLNLYAYGNMYNTAVQIYHNGTPAEIAQTAEVPTALPLNSKSMRTADSGWDDGTFNKDADTASILSRIPTHEPWDEHENINPTKFSSSGTDVTNIVRSSKTVQPPPGTKISSGKYPITAPGTCHPDYAKMIAYPHSQAGIKELKAEAAALGMTGKQALASLLGICGGESSWSIVRNNYDYDAYALAKLWPAIFGNNLNLAQKYAHNPQQLIPFLFDPPPVGFPKNPGSRLGNTQPGDGLRFRDTGYIQLTGRSNYTRYSKLLFDKGVLQSADALVKNPDLLLIPQVSAAAAVMYLLDRVNKDQEDPEYFEAAWRAVNLYTPPDNVILKRGLYNCFYGQLTGGGQTTKPAEYLTDSAGNPIGNTGTFSANVPNASFQ